MENEMHEIYQAVPVTPIPAQSRFFANGREKLFALLSYPLAYYYIWVLDLTELTGFWWYFGLFAVLYCVGAVLLNKHKRGSRETWVWLGAMVICFAGVLLGRSTVWDSVGTVFFLHCFAIYVTLCRSDVLLEGRTGRMLPLDAIRGVFAIPFGNFFLRIRTLAALIRDFKSEKKRGIGWTILAAAAALLLLLWVISLLARADAEFERLTQNLLNWELNDSFWEIFLRFILSLPVGAYFYGLAAGSARIVPETVRVRSGRVLAFFEKLRKVPVTAWAVLLGCFAAVYCVFFAIQGSYLFGAFTRSLPEDFTVAEYARQGFFELCGVMALNFCVLFLALSSAEQGAKASRLLRIMATVVLGQSILLAVTAFSKLWLYIDCFGFTPLRLQSAWLICVLSAGCIASIWSLWSNRRSVRVWVMFSALTLAVLHLF